MQQFFEEFDSGYLLITVILAVVINIFSNYLPQWVGEFSDKQRIKNKEKQSFFETEIDRAIGNEHILSIYAHLATIYSVEGYAFMIVGIVLLNTISGSAPFALGMTSVLTGSFGLLLSFKRLRLANKYSAILKIVGSINKVYS